MENQTCFVIMPIGELPTYLANHFRDVYEYLFAPAIKEAGFTPKRADDEKTSSLIQVNIIQEKLIQHPI